MILRLGSALVLCALLSACGRHSAPRPAAPDVRLVVHAGSAWNSDSLRLAVEPHGQGGHRVELAVIVAESGSAGGSTSGRPLHMPTAGDGQTEALLLDLRFDPTYSASEIESLDLRDATLSMVASQPGVVALGAVWGTHAESPLPAAGELLLSFTLTSGAHGVALAPQGERGQVVDLAAQPSIDSLRLDWSYVNRGDYDQNREANAADLVPLAPRLGQQAADISAGFPFADVESVIDGDANGELNAADIAPIAGNLLRRVSHYRVYGSQTDSGELETLELLGSVPFDQGETLPGKRRTFTHELTGASQLSYPFYFVAPYDGSDGSLGSPSNAAPGGEPDTEPPVWTGGSGISAALPRNAAVNVTWHPAVDALSPPVTYIVYWNTGATVDFEMAQTLEVAAPATGVILDGLTNDLEYAFAVRARDSADPPNVDANTEQRTATPVAVMFGAPGLEGELQAQAQYPALALLPAGEQVDAGAPLLAYTRPDAAGRLELSYMRSGTWSVEAVLPHLSFTHPQVVVRGDRRFIVVFDTTTHQLLALSYTTRWERIGSTVVANLPAQHRVLRLSADYDPGSDRLGIVWAAGTDTQAEVRCAQVTAGVVTPYGPLLSIRSEIVPAVVLRYSPSGEPWLLYTHGTLDREEGYVLDTELVEARLSGEQWEQTVVAHETAPLQLDLTFAGSAPQLAFVGARSRFFVLIGRSFTSSLVLDGYAGSHDGTGWAIERFYTGSLAAEIEGGFPPDYYRLTLRGLLDVKWVRPGELAASVVEGHTIVDWFELEPQEGRDDLQISATYRVSIDGFNNDTGLFSAPALAMSWSGSPHRAVGYIRRPTISGAELWDRYFEPAGPLHYEHVNLP